MFLQYFTLLHLVSFTWGKVQFMGMNIAGFDFGCQIDGTCPLSSVQPPSDGAGQMQHFVDDDQMNIFRFPVSWQFLVNNNIGSTLDATNFGKYDQLMQSCLSTGSYCAIDIHNFARVNGQIIGQGGPSNAQFSDLWSQLSLKYKGDQKVVFGLMNEPHDVDIGIWANTVQAAVTAIRSAGATSQMILLPGSDFASAGQFVPDGSGAALVKVTNPDGSTTGLILDLHKYLDVDNSGEHAECTTDNIEDAFAVVAVFLRQNGRQGLISETGAGSTASCFTDFCAQNTFLNQNSDVFLGYIAWAAGSFSTSYVLSLTPTLVNGKYVDNALASQCVVAPWLNAGSEIVTSAVPSTALIVTSSATDTTPTAVVSVSATTSPITGTAIASLSPSQSLISSETLSGSNSTAKGSSGFGNGSNKTQVVGPTQTTASPAIQSTGGTNSRSTIGGLLLGGLVAAVLI